MRVQTLPTISRQYGQTWYKPFALANAAASSGLGRSKKWYTASKVTRIRNSSGLDRRRSVTNAWSICSDSSSRSSWSTLSPETRLRSVPFAGRSDARRQRKSLREIETRCDCLAARATRAWLSWSPSRVCRGKRWLRLRTGAFSRVSSWRFLAGKGLKQLRYGLLSDDSFLGLMIVNRRDSRSDPELESLVN